MKTLAEIKTEVDRLAAKIGVSEHPTLPTYGYSEGTARAHIEVDKRGYHYVVVERLTESERLTTFDLDAVLYRVFRSVTFHLSCAYELVHRVETQDGRRMNFQHQVELLSQLSKSWGERQAQEQQRILRDHPFDDSSSARLTSAAKLMEAGHSYETAWQMAERLHPSPASS